MDLMIDINTLFKNKKPIVENLAPFGFTAHGDGHVYSADVMNHQFRMNVFVTQDGEVSAEILDSSLNEPYILHNVSKAQGSFVGMVREEYKSVLVQIAERCFETVIFKSDDARLVIERVREKYCDELEFLWKKFSDNAVLRRKDTKKWYAALLILKKSKLGLNGDGYVDIIDLRGRPEDIIALVDQKKYFPGYHMNKKHWYAICLDGSVPMDEIFRRIDESHALALK